MMHAQLCRVLTPRAYVCGSRGHWPGTALFSLIPFHVNSMTISQRYSRDTRNANNYSGSQGGDREISSAPRGFAAMDPIRQREIASHGGSASGGNFAKDPARAAAVGRKGGQHSHSHSWTYDDNE